MTATIDRTLGLGGSDMAAVLGVDRWRAPLDVYLEKVGEAPPVDETEAMRWGTLLEDTVAREWAARHGVSVRRNNRTLTHQRHTWLRGHIDRDVIGKPEILEVKVSSAEGWGEEGTDQIPMHYLPQVHTYLALTGAKVCHVAALLWSFGPPKLQSYVIPRDEEIEQIIIDAGHAFWHQHVLPKVAPEPRTNAECNRRWTRAVAGRTAEFGERDMIALGQLIHWKEQRKLAEERISAAEMELKRSLQDAEALTVDGYPIVTWKSQTAKRFAVKRFAEEHPELHAQYIDSNSYRVLRVSKRGLASIDEITPTPTEENPLHDTE